VDARALLDMSISSARGDIKRQDASYRDVS